MISRWQTKVNFLSCFVRSTPSMNGSARDRFRFFSKPLFNVVQVAFTSTLPHVRAFFDCKLEKPLVGKLLKNQRYLPLRFAFLFPACCVFFLSCLRFAFVLFPLFSSSKVTSFAFLPFFLCLLRSNQTLCLALKSKDVQRLT